MGRQAPAGGVVVVRGSVAGLRSSSGAAAYRPRSAKLQQWKPYFKDISGGRELHVSPALHGELRHLRLYNRALRTSEAIGNFRAASQ